jgi:hypothetical protein
MENGMKEEKTTEDSGCACNCDCDCCQNEKNKPKKAANSDNVSQVHVNDSIGAAFLGVLALLLLIFLVRANKRNRELLLEVIEMRRQA